MFTIHGHASHLGHVASIMLFLQAYIQNLAQKGPVVTEKSKFNFLYVNDIKPRSRNDLDL